jgi:hypothetical protein
VSSSNQQFDGYCADCGKYGHKAVSCPSPTTMTALQQEIERLRAALKTYGGHTDSCDRPKNGRVCACGFRDVWPSIGGGAPDETSDVSRSSLSVPDRIERETTAKPVCAICGFPENDHFLSPHMFMPGGRASSKTGGSL